MKLIRKQTLTIFLLVGSMTVSSFLLSNPAAHASVGTVPQHTQQQSQNPSDHPMRLSLHQQPTQPEQHNAPPIQLFDMHQEKIIKTFKNENYFQSIAKQWLKEVSGLSPQLNIGSNNGYIVRIPLVEPYSVTLGHLTIELNDVFLVYVPDRKPLLLVFSKERKPYLLETRADVHSFMQRILAPTGPGASRE